MMIGQRQITIFLVLAPLISADEALNIDASGIVKARKDVARTSIVRRHSSDPDPDTTATDDANDGTSTAADDGKERCRAPEVVNASCLEGLFIEHGEKCHPECDRQWSDDPSVMAQAMKPSVHTLNCTDGVLTPATYTCHPVHKCKAPSGIENAGTPSCQEGEEVDSENICSPQCKTGFGAYVAENKGNNLLECADGELHPAGFTCMDPTEATNAIAADAAEALANGDNTVANEDTGISDTTLDLLLLKRPDLAKQIERAKSMNRAKSKAAKAKAGLVKEVLMKHGKSAI